MAPGDFVRVVSMKGVACIYLGHARERVYYEDDCDYEVIENEERARVRMVGDDRVFEVDTGECSPILDEEFCVGCGQIGCPHGK